MATKLAPSRLQHMLDSIPLRKEKQPAWRPRSQPNALTTYMGTQSACTNLIMLRYRFATEYASFPKMWGKQLTPVGDDQKEAEMPNSDKETNEVASGVLLPEGLTFYTRFVQKDAKLDDHDRILADCRLDGTFIFQIGLHAPIGKLQKGKAYQLGTDARIKRVQGNRVEVFLNGVDPAAGVDYTSVTEVLELPF